MLVIGRSRMSPLTWVGSVITCVKLKWKIRSRNIADVVVEADRFDQTMFGALKSPSRMSLLLSEERAFIDCITRLKC